MSLLEIDGLQCYIVSNATRFEARACIVDQGIVLVPINEELSELSRKNWWCCRRRRRHDEAPLLQRTFDFDDLLGVSVNAEVGTLQLVHCPRQNIHGPRTRKDIILDFGGRDRLGQAQVQWAARVTTRCNSGERRFLVFVNPASGTGSAPQAWQATEDLWKAVPGIQYTAVHTGTPGHAHEHVRSMDLGSCDGIVVISGDGLVHEVWNGLAARPDAESALALPVGHIPGGSGNGLAKSVLDNLGERYGIIDAAFCIAKGGHQPIDLMHVQAGAECRCVSFLSLSAATIADVDIESERLRCIGSARFTVWAVWRILRPVRLCAELLYWPAEAPGQPAAEPPPLSAELEGQPPWKKIVDDFTIFWGCNTEWTSWDNRPAPGARFCDGIWHLLLLRGAGASRSALLRTLLGLNTGEHVHVPGVEVVRCRAFRLVPTSGSGHLVIDGETVPFGPLQIWPSRHHGSVLGGSSSNLSPV